MSELGAAAAIALALVFAWAGAAKIARPQRTTASFSGLGLPGASVLAVAVPILELSLAATLVMAPVAGAVATLLVLAVFSAVLARAVRSGTTAGCSCFGSAGNEPVSVVDLVRNAMLGLLAAAALAASGWPGMWAVAAVAAALAVGTVGLQLLHRRWRPSGDGSVTTTTSGM